MHSSHSNQETCPLGTNCPWYKEASELKTLVISDPLTGLFNMRHFEETLKKELERTQRTNLPTSLIMIDLDFFKKINDNWGHEVGNLVLKQTSQAIRNNTRALDIQCRYGGEEFAVICPSSDLLMSKQVAQRVHESIANLQLEIEGKPLKVTASLGIATQNKSNAMSVTEFIKQADDQLYLAKQKGRNQICYKLEDKKERLVAQQERDALRDIFKQHADD